MSNKNKTKITASPFDLIDQAYKEGNLAGRKGRPLSDNPYPRLGGALGPKVHGAWSRGWQAGSRKR